MRLPPPDRLRSARTGRTPERTLGPQPFSGCGPFSSAVSGCMPARVVWNGRPGGGESDDGDRGEQDAGKATGEVWNRRRVVTVADSLRDGAYEYLVKGVPESPEWLQINVFALPPPLNGHESIHTRREMCMNGTVYPQWVSPQSTKLSESWNPVRGVGCHVSDDHRRRLLGQKTG